MKRQKILLNQRKNITLEEKQQQIAKGFKFSLHLKSSVIKFTYHTKT